MDRLGGLVARAEAIPLHSRPVPCVQTTTQSLIGSRTGLCGRGLAEPSRAVRPAAGVTVMDSATSMLEKWLAEGKRLFAESAARVEALSSRAGLRPLHSTLCERLSDFVSAPKKPGSVLIEAELLRRSESCSGCGRTASRAVSLDPQIGIGPSGRRNGHAATTLRA